MKISNVLMFSVLGLMILLASLSVARNDSSEDDVFNVEDSSDLAEITDDISASDIVRSEDEVRSERSTYIRRTVSSGSGWITTASKGALLDIHLVSGYVDNKTAISKGWIKAGKLKLKIESTDNTESKKVFDVTAADGSVSGTLVLDRSSKYQSGFDVWTGELDLNVGNDSFDAKVNLAIEEKQIGNDRLKDQKERSEVSYVGALQLGDARYEIQGMLNSRKNRLELDIVGEKELSGEMVLEKTTGNNYIGKLKIENENGDDGELSGVLTATLESDGTSLVGPVKFIDEDSKIELNGDMKVTFTGQVGSSSNNNSDDSDSEESNGEDNSGRENRGFWKRFVDFFGA